ncbi:MAG: MATE family efflux transporter [Hyphomicrobiaceae bacterium]|nr:MATE family efflux transporter [Hyphomicrobiaceae bacterium]
MSGGRRPIRGHRNGTARPPPKFVTGSLLNHILVMTGAGALGLVAIFIGDLANIYFLSLLGDEAIVAAVGYASSIILLTISIGIGLAIAATALVSPALGAGRRPLARRLSASAHAWTFVVACLLSILVWVLIPSLLTLLGAAGRTHQLAASYLEIQVPALPFLALGMTSSAVLRSVGDASRAMYVTLFGAATNILLDPLLIFTFELGIEGAAIASALSRVAVMAMGFYGVIVVHRLMTRPDLARMRKDALPLARVALPAVTTNIATPAANAYVTAAIAGYGDSAVAGWAIIGRIIPVAFGAIYALSGNVGPIIGQNYGARSVDRMRETLTLSLVVTAAYTLAAWFALWLLSDQIVAVFRADGEAARLIGLFCAWLSPLFVFLGALFVANAVFNTLGRATVSTALNWGRATLGTVPFVLAGGALLGADGVLIGNMLGGIVFGILAVVLCYRLMDRLAAEWPDGVPQRQPSVRRLESPDEPPTQGLPLQ